MTYEAVIFDLDGTLVHTAPQYRYRVVNKTLEALATETSEHMIDRFWFESKRESIIQQQFGIDPELFWRIFYKYETISLRRQYIATYDDVDFIKELRGRGFKTGIVTGAPMDIASLEIGLLGESDFDSVIIARESNGVRPKPHPHGIESCLDLLGVDKTSAIYVGNSDEDVEAAEKAQVFDVLLVRGEHEFPEIDPSLRIHSLYELREFLRL